MTLFTNSVAESLSVAALIVGLYDNGLAASVATR